jgi:ferric-dicitrate binding protein FerR (iron transport regulator)
MFEDRIWLLLSRRDNGDITPEEREELEYLLSENEAASHANAFVEEIWKKDFTPLESPDPATSWEHITRRMTVEKPAAREKVFPFSRLKAAASLALLIAFGLTGYLYLHGKKAGKDIHNGVVNQVSTHLGSRTKIILPDGTKVWLNVGSTLSYPDIKHAATREVTLNGEAYFEVVHDPEHPFIVHTHHMEVRDIGTSFDVKYYPSDRQFEATLIEGSIEIINPEDPERKILLKPSEKITIPILPDIPPVKKPDTSDGDETTLYTIAKIKPARGGLVSETAWVQNQLAFDNEPFKELAVKMERWYNVKIYFADSAIAHTRFSGIIKNETVDQALGAMKFSVPFSYEMHDDSIWIK